MGWKVYSNLLAVLRGPKNPVRVAAANSNIVCVDDERATCQNNLTARSFIMEAKRGRRSQTEPPHRSTVMNHRREERRSPAQVERLSETWRDFWGSCRSGTRWGRGDESRRWLAVREARTPVLTSLDGAGPLTPCTPAMTRLFCMSTSLICPPPACWLDQVMLTLRASTCTRTLACLDYPVKHLLLSLWPWLGLSLRCKKKNKPWISGEGCQRGSENKSIHSEGH